MVVSPAWCAPGYHQTPCSWACTLQPIAAAAFQAEQAAAHAHARAAKLAAIDSVLWDCHPFRRGGMVELLCIACSVTYLVVLFQQVLRCSSGAKACRSLARHAGYQLISRLTVDVQNVSVAFKLDAPIASLAAAANFVPSGVWNPRTAGTEGGAGSSAAATPESTAGNAAAPLPRAVRFSPDEPLGSCARLSLRSLTVNSATPHGYGVLATLCQLSGVDLAVDRPHAAGTPGMPRVCMLPACMACMNAVTVLSDAQPLPLHACSAGERLHMVRRWSAHAAVDWRIASRMLDLHRQVGVTPVIQASGSVHIRGCKVWQSSCISCLPVHRKPPDFVLTGECGGGRAACALQCVCFADPVEHSCQLHQLRTVLQLPACPASGTVHNSVCNWHRRSVYHEQNVARLWMWHALALNALQVGPGEVPRLWWQHAACAVLHERRLLAAAGGTCYSTARAGERRMHQHIYKRSKGGLSWLVPALLYRVELCQGTSS